MNKKTQKTNIKWYKYKLITKQILNTLLTLANPTRKFCPPKFLFCKAASAAIASETSRNSTKAQFEGRIILTLVIVPNFSNKLCNIVWLIRVLIFPTQMQFV